MRKVVFARRDVVDYYPAVIVEDTGDCITVKFPDGSEDEVSKDNIIELAEAFLTMEFEADREKRGEYYDCAIINYKDGLTVQYDIDEETEKISLVQLRGSLIELVQCGSCGNWVRGLINDQCLDCLQKLIDENKGGGTPNEQK